jgi:REP element-mobilizing transposase RayT
MKYDPQIHHRRSIRLAGYDYSQAGPYFITICTHNRNLFLQSKRVQEMVRLAWHAQPTRFPTIVLDEFTIMPNHIHGIIILGDAASRDAASSVPTLGKVVRAFKSISAIKANKALNRSGQPFWQRATMNTSSEMTTT